MAMTVSAADGSLVIDLVVDTSAVMAVLLHVDQELADASAMAFQRFGDCFSYALAAHLKVPLLFVGNDFSHTDLKPALGGE
jgi:ribonuclease VapC